MKCIELCNSPLQIQVSDRDYHRVRRYTWRLTHYRGRYAAICRTVGNGGVKSTEHLGRFILGVPLNTRPKDMVWHKDGDKLNFQRSNLRLSPAVVIQYRKRKQITPATSKYKGVAWRKDCEKWTAYISYNSTRISLGVRASEDDAYDLRLRAEEQYFAKALK